MCHSINQGVTLIHEVRVVPLDNPPGLSASVDQWLGVSRGHWEDGTLVIETTNFRVEGRQ